MTGPLLVLGIVAAVLAFDLVLGSLVGHWLRRRRLADERRHTTEARFLGGRR